MVSILSAGLSCPRFNSKCSPKIFKGKLFDVAEVNQQRCLEDSGQWPENLVVTSSKIVYKKPYNSFLDLLKHCLSCSDVAILTSR